MNDILTELSKPIWWISVGLAGVLFNLVASYLKTPLDAVLSGTSSAWRRRSEARKQDWEARIAEIRASDDVRQMAFFAEVRARLQAIYILLLAIFTLLYPMFTTNDYEFFRLQWPVASVVFAIMFGIATATFFISFLRFKRAVDIHRMLREARGPAHTTGALRDGGPTHGQADHQ